MHFKEQKRCHREGLGPSSSKRLITPNPDWQIKSMSIAVMRTMFERRSDCLLGACFVGQAGQEIYRTSSGSWSTPIARRCNGNHGHITFQLQQRLLRACLGALNREKAGQRRWAVDVVLAQAPQRLAGSRRFSSSAQLRTTIMPDGAEDSLAPRFSIIRNRLPSGEIS